MKKEISSKQQIVDSIKKSNNILLVTHSRPDGDAVASVLAMKLILEKINKKADVVVSDEISDRYKFLPQIGTVLKEAKINRDLVININVPRDRIGKIGYNKKEKGGMDLIITPTQGEIKKEDVSFSSGGVAYDLVIILDVASPDILSSFYKENEDLFKDIPVINIDHHPTNPSFGKFNLLDSNATSTCEILVSLAEALGKDLIDKEIATLLLAGIIADTNRFQNNNTTPKSLTVAAQLIASGARRSDIIKNFYKTLPVSTLRVWGKVLANIQEDKDNKIVWSTISKNEIKAMGAKDNEVGGEILNELLSAAPGAKVILLLVERDNGLVTGGMRTSDPDIHLDKIALLCGGGGHTQAAGFRLENTNLVEAEKTVLGKIRSYLGLPEIDKENKDNHEQTEKVLFDKGDKDEDINHEQSYSPSISDIDQEEPSVVDNSTSILQRVINAKKEKSIKQIRDDEEKIDFAKMEKELQKNDKDLDWDLDEDYE